MKKVMTAILALSLALGLTACGGNVAQSGTNDANGENVEEVTENVTDAGTPVEEVTENVTDNGTPVEEGGLVDGEEGPLEGGWSVNGGDLSPDANPDAIAALNKAVDGLTGYVYEPIAVLGSQIVSGSNYRILCRGAVVMPDAAPVYEIVTVYEDLEGAAQITGSAALTDTPRADENGAPLLGGWSVNGGEFAPDAEDNADVKEAFEKALEGLTGANYEAVAYMASQVVAGMNYQLFCRVTPVEPDAVPAFAVVTIYADLEGNAEITEVTDVDFAAL